MLKYFIGEWNADLYILYNILEEIPIVSGSDRNRMYYVNPKIGGSILYGYTVKSYVTPTKNREYCEKMGLYKTKIKSEYPELDNVFNEFSELYLPNYKWQQIQINKNYKCPPHKDVKNKGISCIVCCGGYKGGNLCIENKEYDPRSEPIFFDGSKYTHWTSDFEGDNRYSVVFFNSYNPNNL
jgi:hypothetical protein